MKNKAREIIFNHIPLAFTIFGVLVIWQIVAQIGIISQHILPSPISVYVAFVSNISDLTIHSIQTLKEALIGLFISIFFGVFTAILLDSYSKFRKIIYPLLITSQTIQLIAIAPLLLIWFGFEDLPKIIIVVLFCFFPITIATVSGFSQISTDLLKLLKSMNASNLQILFKIKIPGALPQFFAGLKIAVTYSVTGAIVGEYVGAYQGLGIYLQEMAHAFAIDVVFAIIFVTVILSAVLFWLVVAIEKICIPWN